MRPEYIHEESIAYLKQTLEVDISELACMLGITTQTLQEWECLPLLNYVPKSQRVTLLYKTVLYIENNFKHVEDIKEILWNCSIIVGDDEERVSLINYMNANNDLGVYEMMLGEIVDEYLKGSKNG